MQPCCRRGGCQIILTGAWLLVQAGAPIAAAQTTPVEIVERVRAQAELNFAVPGGSLCAEPPPEPASRPALFYPSGPGRVVEFSVTGTGSGASSGFMKSSCLFCVKYMKEGQILARSRAALDVQARCQDRGGYLKSTPNDHEINCRLIDSGDRSYYLCGARSSATCAAIAAY